MIILGALVVVAIVVVAGAIGYVVGRQKSSPTAAAPSASSSGPAGGPSGSAAAGSAPTGSASAAPSASKQSVLPFSGLKHPAGVAVDDTGAVFVSDSDNRQVLVLPANSTAQVALQIPGLGRPDGVAVGNGGTVYVADPDNHVVWMVAANATSTTAPTPVNVPFTSPHGVAWAAPGMLVVVDGRQVLEISSDQPGPRVDRSSPQGVAVDIAENVYFTDSDRVLVWPLGAATAATQLPFTGLKGARGVAVDKNGSVYVADFGNKRVLKLAVGSNSPTELPFNGLSGPVAVAVDAIGNVYVVDNNQVVKLAPS